MEAPIKTPETQQLNRTQRKELRKEEARKRRSEKLKAAIASLNEPSRREKFNEGLTLISFACTVGSWGWSVVAPDSSVWFGSILLLVAVLLLLIAVFRVWRIGKLVGSTLAIAVLGLFGFFDWHVVIKPQRGKPFKELLVSGYHMMNDCGTRSAKDPMPTWLRDQSKGWQAQVAQLISQKLDYKYIQMWQGSGVLGLVSDENMTAYQCTVLSVKVGALETIIAENYDPALKHEDYDGPLYWFESVDGKVDISESLKRGGGRFVIHEKPTPGPNSPAVQVTGQMPK
jgi:hypothetical protein